MSKAIITFSSAPTTPNGVFKHFLGGPNAQVVPQKFSPGQFNKAYPNSPFAGIGATVDLRYGKFQVEFSCSAILLAEIAETVSEPTARPRPYSALRMSVEFVASGKRHHLLVKQRSVINNRTYRNWDAVRAQLKALSPQPTIPNQKHALLILKLANAAIAAGI